MATSNKDFVVKNGLQVATGVTFGDSTTQTTAYNPNTLKVPSASSFPLNPVNGQMFLDSDDGKLYVYFGQWLEISYVTAPPENLLLDGGTPSTSLFDRTFDGGTPSTVSFDGSVDGGTL